MKSLNTKKIVALAAGAALLGGALLGAGSVTFGNTELVNANGNVVAKVVVGDNAAATDGVAAANIAAVLGNRAFKQTEVTATPTGLDGLSCEVSGEGSEGTCEVLSKSVTLEIVTPAGTVPAGAYAFTTLIDDFIDANLEDRSTGLAADNEDAPWGEDEPALKVGPSQFPSLESTVINDNKAGKTYSEEQYLYIAHDGTSKKVKYDTGDDVLIAEDLKIGYEVDFDSPGIPVCSDSKGGNWAYCKYSNTDYDENKQTENHRVKIRFLGEDWIISEMNPPQKTTEPSSGEEADDLSSSVKLAKESAYSPKLQIGESLDLGDGYKLTLGDLKPASGSQGSDYAIFSVYNADGEEVANEMVAAGDTTEIVTSDGHSFRVRVYQAAPGYTLTEKWAEVAVFSNELELKDGDSIDDDENDDWEVALKWRNEDTNNLNDKADEYYDHLLKIQLYNEDVGDLNEGDSVTILEDPAVWKFAFTGLNLDSDDYVRVDISVDETDLDFYNAQPGDETQDDKYELTKDPATDEDAVFIKATDDIFVVTVDGKKYHTDELVVSPFGWYYNSSVDSSNYTVLFKYDGKYYVVDGNYNAGGHPNGASAYGDTSSNQIDPMAPGEHLYYELDGKRYGMGILIQNITTHDDSATIDDALDNIANTFNISQKEAVYIVFGEDADNNDVDYIVVRAQETANDSRQLELGFKEDDFTNYDEEKIAYLWATSGISQFDGSIFGGSNLHTEEAPYLTHHGSWIKSLDTDSVSLHLAKKVGKAQFLLQAIQTETSEEGSVERVLHEGDETSLSDGVKIRVKSIDCETGACTAGTGSATVAGVDGVSCELNVPAANLGVRQDVPSDLVVLDSQAAGLETVIAVGGPAVNTVTAAILEGTNAELNAPGDTIVQEVETGKIVVAGYNAEDTLAAAQQFISSLV